MLRYACSDNFFQQTNSSFKQPTRPHVSMLLSDKLTRGSGLRIRKTKTVTVVAVSLTLLLTLFTLYAIKDESIENTSLVANKLHTSFQKALHGSDHEEENEKEEESMAGYEAFSDDLFSFDVSGNKSYEAMTFDEKAALKAKKFHDAMNDTYILDNTPTHTKVDVRIQEFLDRSSPDSWINRNTLYYDPRLTLSLYINEIKAQLLQKNPENKQHDEKYYEHHAVVPFAWQDWVDLTALNEHLVLPLEDRPKCDYLLSKIAEEMSYNPAFCVDNSNVNDTMVEKTALPSRGHLPGYVVYGPSDSHAPNAYKWLEGKSNLLTFAPVPLNIIFLSKDGVYEAVVEKNKKRLVDSNLLKNYLARKRIDSSHDVLVEMDPAVEFKFLVAEVPPQAPNYKIDGGYNFASIRSNNNQFLPLNKEMFSFTDHDVKQILFDYERRVERVRELSETDNYDELYETSLNNHEISHYKALKYSSSFDEMDYIYYHLARLKIDETNSDEGWHYDWRFFNGGVDHLKETWTGRQATERKKIVLNRIARNWFRFSHQKGIISWIAHGSLLAWYFDGISFPYDNDLDIQMPIQELDKLSRMYNQTLVVEDPTEGFGKFFIDSNVFITHRTHGNGLNNIDARFIDVDTGLYIDITGLSKTNQKVPDRYIKGEEVESEEIYNDRNNHFFAFEEISPMKFDVWETIPNLIPNKFEFSLGVEYGPGGLTNIFNNWYFVKQLGLWIHRDIFMEIELFDSSSYQNEDGEFSKNKFDECVTKMSEAEILRLLDHKETILEYYITRPTTKVHEEAMEIYGDCNGESLSMENQMKYEDLVVEKVEQHYKPLRKPLFEFEHYGRFALTDFVEKR